jgi:hypothetical protein
MRRPPVVEAVAVARADATLPDRRLQPGCPGGSGVALASSTGGAAMFGVSHRGEGIDDADDIEGAREIVRGQPPGRYDVDEIRAEPFPSGHTSRPWGRRLRHPDGWVEDELWPWA